MRLLVESPGKRTPKRHVALLIETSNEYARGLLRGIRSYIGEHHSWSLYLHEHSRGQGVMPWATNWQGDGIIARIENEAVAEYVRQTAVPTVDLSSHRLLPELPCLETDDLAIARMAFSHLQERGFKQFAFCGDPRFPWSVHRREHFIQEAQHAGYPCHVYEVEAQEGWNKEHQAMISWIRELPKPVGILVSYDMLGQKLLDVCRQARVFVPDQAAVISVDNDELLCSLSAPPLSSIIPDTLATGYQAAALLDRMMKGEPHQPGITSIPPLDVALRVSTDVIAVKDPLVADTVRLIRSHLYENISMEKLLSELPASRRALETRFQRALGRTPHRMLLEMRIKLIKQFLTDTELTLPSIAERIGFKHAEYMSVLFKRETGMTPNDYRKKVQGDK
ncbi:DNA-binding transcriptional regulator [Paenibacillus sp. CC-CFT747]|nr:DNA-binding transcriptional regulator [Paenibacillus sp. CC-CFT747]